jgi:chain length determinant protein (polysaccharide antigen chain regulator)
MNELSIVLSKNTNTNTNTNTPQSVFDEFQANLESRQTLKYIFDKYDLIKIYHADIEMLSGAEELKAKKKAFSDFMKDFSIKRPSAKDYSKRVSVGLALSLSEQEVADILNDLVKIAEQKTILQFYNQIIAEKKSRIGLLNDRILSVRKIASDKRMDRIAQLDEAIMITKKLGLNKPVSSGPTLNVNNVNTTRAYSSALYLLGSDLLVAEKTVLETRKSDDPFIPELRDLQEQLQKIQTLKVDKSEFGVVNIDQAAFYGDKIKPKKALILAVAGVLGLMLGVFVALIRRAIKNRKQEDLATV